MSEKKIYKPKPVSGFPEWLPQIRRIEQHWFDHIRNVFESYGYCSIETPSVEELDVLAAKGEVDKEIYVIDRLHKDDDDKEARLALHFDQTVPLARYVAQRFNDLDFPFKRYQMQRVWRGERPQAGRFREFYQCDIDVIAVDNLPLHFDAEVPSIMIEILQGLDIGAFQMQLSNRKILMGFLAGLGITDSAEVLRTIDKKDKIGGDDGVRKLLHSTGLLTDQQIEKIIGFTHIKTPDSSFAGQVRALGVTHETLEQGLNELVFVMDNLQHLQKDLVVADLSIVRGLDYYTGTVYETRFIDDPHYGSICSGGRYEDLAGSYINKHLPGVGISIGFSRLFDYMRTKNNWNPTRKTPTDILVVLPAEDRRHMAADTARILRARGFNVELYHADQKLSKQLGYAEKKGIPFVWFPPFDEAGAHEIKDMTNGTQTKADPHTWTNR
jgi:histidyl-tRNA synthetase